MTFNKVRGKEITIYKHWIFCYIKQLILNIILTISSSFRSQHFILRGKLVQIEWIVMFNLFYENFSLIFA